MNENRSNTKQKRNRNECVLIQRNNRMRDQLKLEETIKTPLTMAEKHTHKTNASRKR